MAEENFLSHFINEPIYLIKSDEQPAEEAGIDDTTTATEEHTKVEESREIYVKALPTEGQNLKHCIVLVQSEDQILESTLKELLFKIMGSVKRKPEDLMIVNCREADQEQIEALLANHNHRHLLAFDVDMVTTMKNSSLYMVEKQSAVSMLKADALSTINTDVEKKKALWKALQEMFL